jgi:hypothetical protein
MDVVKGRFQELIAIYSPPFNIVRSYAQSPRENSSDASYVGRRLGLYLLLAKEKPFALRTIVPYLPVPERQRQVG